MKILITGVNGMIGSIIAAHLLQYYDVIGTSIEETNHTGLPICYLRSDISDAQSLAILPVDIDVIVHCAAVITNDALSNVLLNVNCLGVQNIAAFAQKSNCKQVIYFSSLPIIGKPKQIPITEEHPIDPPTVYHLTKYFGEILFKKVLDDILLTVFRIPSPIGEKTPSTKIIPTFVRNAIENKDYCLLGHGKRTQNYIDIRDIAEAIYCAIEKKASGVFNIASEHSYSNLEVAQKCISIFNSSSQICFSGEDKEEDYQWIVSTDKAKKELGFIAKYSLDETLLTIGKNYKSL